MRSRPTELPGVLIIEPDVFRDERGFFLETYHAERYREQASRAPFVQDNHSRSVAACCAGCTSSCRRAQGKLVRVIEGEIFDVAVDVRRGSPTFGRWVGVTLSAENFRQMLRAARVRARLLRDQRGGAGRVQVHRRSTTRPSEIGIAWNDPALAIAWPVRRAAAVGATTAPIGRLRSMTDSLPCLARQNCNTATKSSVVRSPFPEDLAVFRTNRPGTRLPFRDARSLV